jgi:hypothetical protein
MSIRSICRVFVVASVLTLCPIAADHCRAQSATHDVTLTGTVGCSLCSGKHSRPKLKIYTNLSCTVHCTRNLGSSYVLVVGNKTYTLEGDHHQLEKFAGGSATVTGNLDGSIFKVTTMEPVSKKK